MHSVFRRRIEQARARRMLEVEEAAQKILDDFDREHEQQAQTSRPQARVCRMRAWQSGACKE